MAFALHEGDTTMLDLVPSTEAVRIVARALDRPTEFLIWALDHCSSPAGSAVIDAARRYLASATWGWDKATILGAAYLASTGAVPTPAPAPPSEHFPYWVALDKHTPIGKEELRRLSLSLKIAYRQLIWAGFYCESAIVNSLESSPWFEVERSWRLRKAGLDHQSAAELWRTVWPSLSARLSNEAEQLRTRVERGIASQDPLFP
jgi:hypothetical protein